MDPGEPPSARGSSTPSGASSPDAPSPARSAGAPPSSGRRSPEARRPRLRWLALTAAVLTVVWAVLVAVAALGVRSELVAAEERLGRARDALGSGDTAGALAGLDAADEHLAAAETRLGRPHVRLAARLPVVGANLRTVDAIATGAQELVTAGRAAVGTAVEVTDAGLDPDGLPVAAIAALAGPVRSTADAAAAAHRRVEDVGERFLVEQVADARVRFLELLDPLVEDTAVAADLLEVLPGFLGADGPRRYLLLTANPAELRGHTGYLGSYSTVTLDAGRLAFGRFGALSDLPDAEPDEVDAGVLADRYRVFGGPWRWKAAHATPDVPSAAAALEQLWQVTTGEALDGVIVVDPFALAALLEVTGPATTADGVELAAEDAVDYLTNGAYADFDDADERKEVLGEVATVVLDRFLASAGSAIDRLDELAAVVADGHLILHAADPEVQAAFAAAGIDGALPDPEGDFLAVVANSGSNSKVDYYLTRELTYAVELAADGEARGELTVDLHNGAPRSGQPSYVIGPNLPSLEAGDSLLHVSLYCATSCELEGAETSDGGRLEPTEELGHPVAGTWVHLPAGGSEELRARWRTADAWRSEDGLLHYRLTVRTQNAVQEPTLRVRLAVPEGFELEAAPPGATVDRGAVVWEASDRGTRTFEVSFRAPSRDTDG